MALVSQSAEPLLTLLERFNRKERFILFEQATTGIGRTKLVSRYRSELSRQLELSVPEQGLLVLIDYHLNWLYAALELYAGTWAEGASNLRPREAVPAVELNNEKHHALERNQEDIDLLVAWQEVDTTQIVLVEAKAHSGWTNKQMSSKAARLEAIFGRRGDRYPGVAPHFALTSFTAPSKLVTDTWPSWMLANGEVAHVSLQPPDVPRLTVGEVDAQGTAKVGGGFYGIRD